MIWGYDLLHLERRFVFRLERSQKFEKHDETCSLFAMRIREKGVGNGKQLISLSYHLTHERLGLLQASRIGLHITKQAEVYKLFSIIIDISPCSHLL